MSEQAWATVILGFFGLMTTIVTSVTAVFMARVKGDTGKAVELSQKASVVQEEIHKAVNSNHKDLDNKLIAALALLDQANKEILQLSIDKAAKDAAGIPIPTAENPLPVAIVAVPEEVKKS